MANLKKFSKPIPIRQSGVVLFITLVALVVMLIASVALIRSSDINLLMSGSLAFKRDVVNQAERAMPAIRNKFLIGALTSGVAKQTDHISTDNYYATILASSNQGIPNVLLDTAVFDAAMPNNNIVYAAGGITVRYVIDRMCVTGTVEVSAGSCTISKPGTDFGGDAFNIENKLKGEDGVVYRISMRATGPKNTEAFLQSTFTI